MVFSLTIHKVLIFITLFLNLPALAHDVLTESIHNRAVTKLWGNDGF